MLNDTFANRLQKALNLRNMKPSELVEKTHLDKSLISNYLSGKYKAKQDKLTILAKALDVSEVWLMGYDIPSDNNKNITTIVSDDETGYKVQLLSDEPFTSLSKEEQEELIQMAMDQLYEMKRELKKEKE